MRKRVALACLCLFSLPFGSTWAQPPAPTAAVNPATKCRAVGLLVLDVSVPSTPKITLAPKKLPVTFPKPGELDNEVCFSVLLVGGDKRDRLDQLNFKDFKSKKGRKGQDVFTLGKTHGPSTEEVISLVFFDTPDWDENMDGVLEDVIQPFDLAARFKGKSVVFDPEIIIQKPGG